MRDWVPGVKSADRAGSGPFRFRVRVLGSGVQRGFVPEGFRVWCVGSPIPGTCCSCYSSARNARSLKHKTRDPGTRNSPGRSPEKSPSRASELKVEA